MGRRIGKATRRDVKREDRTKSRAYKTRLLKKLELMEDPENIVIENKIQDFSDIYDWD